MQTWCPGQALARQFEDDGGGEDSGLISPACCFIGAITHGKEEAVKAVQHFVMVPEGFPPRMVLELYLATQSWV